MEQIRNVECAEGELGGAKDVLEGVALLGAVPRSVDDGGSTVALGQRGEPEHEQGVEVAGERSDSLDRLTLAGRGIAEAEVLFDLTEADLDPPPRRVGLDDGLDVETR